MGNWHSSGKLFGYPKAEVTETVAAMRFCQTGNLLGLLMVGNIHRGGIMPLSQFLDAELDYAILRVSEEEAVLLESLQEVNAVIAEK